MSRRHNIQYASDIHLSRNTVGAVFASGTTVPADNADGYAPGCVFVHEDGAAGSNLYVNDGTFANCDFNALSSAGADQNLADEVDLGFGAPDVQMRWDTSDANANKFIMQLPAGTAVNVPVLVIGQALSDVDMAIHDGITEPTVMILGTGAVATGPRFEFRKSRGTATAPTVVTSADDVGQIDAYACVAAAEWVRSAQILFECTGTVATTRGPGVITFKTATDAAPSVLTTALTISAAQLVTCAAGLTVTTGTATVTAGDVTITAGHLNFTAASDINVAANTAVALEVDDGTTAMLTLDTRNTVSVQTWIFNGPASQTLPNAATARSRTITVPAKTVTLVGTTQVTTLNEGTQVEILAPTYNQSGGAVTVDKVSTLFVGTPVAGASVTITTNHIIMTGTAGCFCTAAGTWTDTSLRAAKRDFAKAEPEDVVKIFDDTEVLRFRYIDSSDGGVLRIGGIAEDVPEALAAKGRQGIAARDVAWAAFAGVKMLLDEIRSLKEKLLKLEAL